MKKNKEILTKFIKESLLFETRMSNSNNYSSNISQEIRQITQKYVFDQEYLSVLLSWFNEGKTERLYDIKVKDITTGQTINIDYQLEGLFQKYIELYEKINRDAFGSRRQEQEVFYCKLGAVLFFNLNQSGITKISYFNNSSKEKETYGKFDETVTPGILQDYADDPALLSYVEFIRKLLVRMSMLTKKMLKNSVEDEEDLKDYRIKFNRIDAGRIKKELADYNLEFASDKMIAHGSRDIVLIKTKGYGNVAFYKRSGTGTGNNLFQGNNLKWLPFGGLCTEISDIDRPSPITNRYTAESATWLCKLPRSHPESDGTGKFLKLYGEFFYISLALSQGNDNFGLTKVSSDDLIQKFFKKSRAELNDLRFSKAFDFDLDNQIDKLYGAFAINQGLHRKGALKQDWLPSSHTYTGSKVWGKNIGHDSVSFKNAIRSI